MPDAIKIMVVEDHHVVRQGLVALLNGVPGMQVVAETADGGMALTLFRKHLPDVVLMDLRLPGIAWRRGDYPHTQPVSSGAHYRSYNL